MPDDGFLVHYKITTDQRVLLSLGYGGLTDFIGRFEYKEEKKRLYHATDSTGNKVEIGKNFARITREDGMSMLIGISFDGEIGLGSSKAMEDSYPSIFLSSTPENTDDWLIPAIQSENETYYFSDYNHANVQRIKLNPEKELKCINFEAVANEVMGISIAR